MALTATLNTQNPQGAGIIQPVSGGGGFISGLSDLARGVISGGAALGARREVDKVNAVRNATTAAALDAQLNAENQLDNPTAAAVPVALGGVNPGFAPEIPGEVMESGRSLQKMAGAVTQGATTKAAFDIRFESVLEDLRRKYPEQQAVIYGQLQAMGFDHYLFRDLKAEIASQDNEVAQRQAQENTLVNAAISSGLGLPSDDKGTLMTKGRDLLAVQAQYKASKEQLDMLKTQTDIDETVRKRNETGAKNGLVKAAINSANMRVNTVSQALGALTVEALSDPTGGKFKELQDRIPLIQQGIATTKAAAIAEIYAGGGGPEEAKATGDYYDNIREGIVQTYTGELSRVRLNQQTLQGMQTQFGIDAAQAFPLWMQLSKLPGMANALPMMFGGDPSGALSPEIQKQIRGELNGWSPGSNTGMYHIQRVADLMRGELKLNNMTQQEAVNTMPTLVTAVRGNRDAIASGQDNTTASGTAFMKGVENIFDATFALQPGSDINSQVIAAKETSDERVVAALTALQKNPDTNAEATGLLFSLRATSAKGLETARRTGSDKDVTGIWSLKYNPQRMIYEVTPSKAGYDDWAKSYTGNAKYGLSGKLGPSQIGATAPSFERMVSNRPSELDKKATAMNRHLSQLVRTFPLDDSLPKSASPKSVAAHYATGAPLTTATGQVIKSGSGEEAKPFSDRLNALTQAATSLVTDTIENTAANLARPSFRNDADALARTIIGEASPNATERVAVGQVILNRAKQAGRSVQDVVLAKGQFEPWGNPETTQRLMSIQTSDPKYQEALQLAQNLLSGSIPDPTGGADHFYAPKAQAALGRKPPKWDDGSGTDIGQTRFFRRGYNYNE